MDTVASRYQQVRASIQKDRLTGLATRLVEVPSPTGRAGAAADLLAAELAAEGFAVGRPAAGHPAAPAVVARLDSGRPGRTLQFDGHLDTVHLPFVPPTVGGGMLRGSGAADMKAGIAAAVEAMLALRDSGLLAGGSVLLTAHDLHEAPWGDGSQLDAMIRDGIVGDAVMLPEPLDGHLPTLGRGQACWKLTLGRPGPPVHEVMRPPDEPSVIAAGADFISRLERLDRQLAEGPSTEAGRASVFVGQVHAGEIYNQFPQECRIEGTRRWLPGTDRAEVEAEFRALLGRLAEERGVSASLEYRLVRDAFRLDDAGGFVSIFRAAYRAYAGRDLPDGPKPFVDDGNSFWALAGVPAVTHGPRAGGQHTTAEWVSIDDLVRVAGLYAAVALQFCAEAETPR